jgi:hypothetical protein
MTDSIAAERLKTLLLCLLAPLTVFLAAQAWSGVGAMWEDAPDGGVAVGAPTLNEKVNKCMDIMMDGYARLRENREKKLAAYRSRQGAFAVTPINQEGLRFG